MTHKLLEACRETGCPVCRLEQRSVERYLDSQFYESVNDPAWRDRLRASLGFCHEHVWLAVGGRLGDALGFALIYRDIINGILARLEGGVPNRASRHSLAMLKRIPEQVRNVVERMLYALTPQKQCPACQHRDEITHLTLAELVKELEAPEIADALQKSDGLCLPHLRLALEQVKSVLACEKLLTIHREKLEGLKAELAEFIRKNDYHFIEEGFGKEGDAWLRAVGMIAGSRKEKR
jgi:uncharacterized protein DUF6062